MKAVYFSVYDLRTKLAHSEKPSGLRKDVVEPASQSVGFINMSVRILRVVNGGLCVKKTKTHTV